MSDGGEGDAAEVARLRWRCRRGTRELDWVLERFLDGAYGGLSAAERAAFERLLAAEDDRLADWLLFTRGTPDDPELAPLVERIRTHAGI